MNIDGGVRGLPLDLLVSRIVAGYLRYPQKGQTVCIKHPTPDIMYQATELYYETLEKAEEEGLMTDDDIFSLLYSLGIWNDDKEKAMTNLPNEMEQFKVHIYNRFMYTKEREQVRSYLNRAREVYNLYSAERHMFDHIGCDGMANFAKWLFIIENSCYYSSGKPIDWSQHNLSNIMNFYYESFISEEVLRDIVKKEPWSSIWSSSKRNGKGVFENVGVNLTHDQRRLILWSAMYDNINESSECPTEKIIMDNDALDGWLVIKRKERETGALKGQTEKMLSDKVSKADEIYLVATNNDEIKEIEKLNDVHASNIKRARVSQLKREGQVNEIDFQDSRQKIAIALAQKGKRG